MMESTNIILLQIQAKKFILVRLALLILHTIKMKTAKIGTLIDTRKMKPGLNQLLILLVLGLVGCFGISQALKKATQISKDVSIYENYH